MDHFIPWHFVLHNQMWNLVPTFCDINSKKSDNLLEYNKYIDGVCDMQFLAYTYVVNHNKKDQLEEYIDILRINDYERLIKIENREEFNKRIQEVIYY